MFSIVYFSKNFKIWLHFLSKSFVNCPMLFMRYKFPVRLSFAMTTNKAQRQTLKTVGMNLLRRLFSHSQLYVELSRMRDRDGLRVLLPFYEETENSGDPVESRPSTPVFWTHFYILDPIFKSTDQNLF